MVSLRRSRLASGQPPARGPLRMPLLVLALVLAAAACGGGGSSPAAPAPLPEGAVFRVQALDETFHVLLENPARIAEAEAVLASGQPKLVVGRVQRGDGGFNQPWSWHLAPASVELADLCAELFDGRPSDVEADLDYWVDTVRFFCPWSGQLVARVR